MRFMMLMIPKGYERAEPSAMPDAKAVAAMISDFPEDVQVAAAGFTQMQAQAQSGQRRAS
jgi:hypothetical protein